MSRAKKSEGKDRDQVKFEDVMQRLEGIVESMESGELDLEQVVEKYQEGMKLVKLCHEKLEKAREKVEKLTRENQTFKLSQIEKPDEEL